MNGVELGGSFCEVIIFHSSMEVRLQFQPSQRGSQKRKNYSNNKIFY